MNGLICINILETPTKSLLRSLLQCALFTSLRDGNRPHRMGGLKDCSQAPETGLGHVYDVEVPISRKHA